MRSYQSDANYRYRHAKNGRVCIDCEETDSKKTFPVKRQCSSCYKAHRKRINARKRLKKK